MLNSYIAHTVQSSTGGSQVEQPSSRRALPNILEQIRQDMHECSRRHQDTLAKLHELERRIVELQRLAENDPAAALALEQIDSAVFAVVPKFEELRRILESGMKSEPANDSDDSSPAQGDGATAGSRERA